MSRTLVIESGETGKGRAFSAELLGYVTADALWDGGQAGTTNVVRPVYLTLALSEQEAGPFVANLRAGRKATLGRDRHPKRFELLRSAGYAFALQRHPEGVLATAYLPELFRLDPGMVDPTGARFVVLPDAGWCREEAWRLDILDAVEHVRSLRSTNMDFYDALTESRDRLARVGTELAEIVPTSALFAAYLDRRVRAPLIPDLRFYLQVLVAALGAGLATVSDGHHRARLGFETVHLDELGFAPGVAFLASHEQVETLLAAEVARFYERVRKAA